MRCWSLLERDCGSHTDNPKKYYACESRAVGKKAECFYIVNDNIKIYQNVESFFIGFIKIKVNE